MLSLPTRDFKVEWGSTVLDEGMGIQVNSVEQDYGLELAYGRSVATVAFTLRIASPTNDRATDLAAMATLKANLEALRKPRQHLKITLVSGHVVTDWDPSTGVRSAFQLYPTLSKSTAPDNGGISEDYTWTVTCGRPADLEGQGYRRSSNTRHVYTINGRKMLVVQGVWTAGGAHSALENYQTNGAAYFTAQQALFPLAGSAEWIESDEDPSIEDENSELVVTRTFWEVVNGLRDLKVRIAYDKGTRLRIVTISGVYTKCASFPSAFNAYSASVVANCTAVLSSVGGNYDPANKPCAELVDKNTTDEALQFSREYCEIPYPQGPGGFDDANVGFMYQLDVSVDRTWEPQTGGTTRVSRLHYAEVTYQVAIDYTSSSGNDPNSLWNSKFKAHCLAALTAKMGVTTPVIVDERPLASLAQNHLLAHLVVAFVDGTGGVIELHLEEEVELGPAVDLIDQASGTAFDYKGVPEAPIKLLRRMLRAEYLAGTTEPAWTSGESDDGYDYVDTGGTAEDDLIAQRNPSYAPTMPGWIARVSRIKRTSSSRGANDEIQTVKLDSFEAWQFASAYTGSPDLTVH